MPHCGTRAGSSERPKSALRYAVLLLPVSERWRRASCGADCDLQRGPCETTAMLTATRKVLSGNEDRNDPVTDKAAQN
jgi:hypothetical protein